MSIPTAECIRHSALVESKVHTLATCRSVRRRKGSKMGVLTQEPRGSPHPGAERVSSPKSREGPLTQEARGSPHPGAERVSSPGYQESVLTPKSIGCPHPSPRAASLTYLRVSHTKVTWRHQTNKWWSSTSPEGVTERCEGVVPIG